MGRFIRAGSAGQLADGQKKKISIAGRDIMLARVNGRFYATDNLCPHLKGDLSAGTLEGTVIACPLQGSQFDIRDGRVLSWRAAPADNEDKARPLKTYDTRVENNTVYIEF